MTTLPRTLRQPHQLLAIGSTLLLHALLIGYLLQQEFDNPPPEPVVRSIQMRVVTIPPVQQQPVVKPPEVEPIKKEQQPEKVIPEQKPATKPAEPKAAPVTTYKPEDSSQATTAKSTSVHKSVPESSSATNTLAEHGADKKDVTVESKADTSDTHKPAEAGQKVQAALAAEPPFDVKNYQPVSKQAPDYPARAMDQGLQGDCTVSYSVNAQGRVENPQAEADCHPLFIRPAINAAKNFQYQPRVVNGQAVGVQKVRNTFQFRISGR